MNEKNRPNQSPKKSHTNTNNTTINPSLGITQTYIYIYIYILHLLISNRTATNPLWVQQVIQNKGSKTSRALNNTTFNNINNIQQNIIQLGVSLKV